jgi:hypothetical protein
MPDDPYLADRDNVIFLLSSPFASLHDAMFVVGA